MSLTQLQVDCLKDSVSRWEVANEVNFNYVKVISDSVDWGFQFHPEFGTEVAEVEGWNNHEDIYIFLINRDFIIVNVEILEGAL